MEGIGNSTQEEVNERNRGSDLADNGKEVNKLLCKISFPACAGSAGLEGAATWMRTRF